VHALSVVRVLQACYKGARGVTRVQQGFHKGHGDVRGGTLSALQGYYKSVTRVPGVLRGHCMCSCVCVCDNHAMTQNSYTTVTTL
jgi:hypothetical protein